MGKDLPNKALESILMPALPTLPSLGPFESSGNEPAKDALEPLSDLLAAPLPSPLDKMLMGGAMEPNPFSRSWFTGEELADEFSALPTCQRGCVGGLHDAMKGVLKPNQYEAKYHRVCRAYREARSCVEAERERCGENSDMFGVLTSGVHYMCIEQGKAFNATIGCIDREAHAVKSICEDDCHYHNTFVNILTRTSAAKGFGDLLRSFQSRDMAPAFGEKPIPLDPSLFNFGPEPKTGKGFGLLNDLGFHQAGPDANSFRDFLEVTDQACVYAECALSCFRTRFNKRCEGNAGSMISETIVRPLVEGHQKFSPLFIALGVVAPRSCSFLYKGSRLLRHRIDPKTNEELWKTYGVAEEEELAAAAEESANGANPFDPNAINADSDLDRLINLVYTNETFEEENAAELFNATTLTEDDIHRALKEKEKERATAIPVTVDVDATFSNKTGALIETERLGDDSISRLAVVNRSEVEVRANTEVMLRWNLSEAATVIQFTPNISGSIHCQIIHHDL
ncbi:hypothetical protein Q1695_004417 [Nippostrongylus brasiliensis]|nr:hypothetical protein Q1695_004417 [Nippostrongylus brasiliensis]